MTRSGPPSDIDVDRTLSDQAARLDRLIAEMRAAKPRLRKGAIEASTVAASGAGEINVPPTAVEPSCSAAAPLSETPVPERMTKSIEDTRLPPATAKTPAKKPVMQRPTADQASLPEDAAVVDAKALRPPPRHVTLEREDAGDAPDVLGGPRPSDDAPLPLQKPSHRKHDELWQALYASRRSFWAVCRTSVAINMLMLTGPLFMLQVYDRVMTSGSVPTLLALSALTAGLYSIIGVLEYIRSHVIVRMGVEADQRIGNRIFQASLARSLTVKGAAVPALRELDTLRNFLAGPGPLTFFDAIFTPFYLLVVFSLHWSLGLSAFVGAVLLVIIAWASDKQSRAPLAEAAKAATRSLELAETGQRNAEALTAMGMQTAYRDHWQTANREALAWQVLAADRLGGLSSVSKALRLLLQSLMLAVGAGLALKGEITAGSIVAATIIFGRAIAPVEQAISQWRSFVKAVDSYKKLDDLLTSSPPPRQKTGLPRPRGILEISGLRVAAPETKQLILSNLTFDVKPGEVLAVIGPSASGKSTLARTLVGLWAPFAGTIKLDGARLDQWDSEALGRYIGYLPQDVELFAGTVRENISRFRTEVHDDAIVAAARQAHAHELIMALPKGYETQLGAFGTYLSAGQRQRVALARAVYDAPALIVLDEPNANLDRNGDEALSAAIDGMRERGQSVVIISHRVQAIGKADKLLYVERGVQRAFGPRNEVMKLFNGAPPVQGPSAGAPLAQQRAAG